MAANAVMHFQMVLDREKVCLPCIRGWSNRLLVKMVARVQSPTVTGLYPTTTYLMAGCSTETKNSFNYARIQLLELLSFLGLTP